MTCPGRLPFAHTSSMGDVVEGTVPTLTFEFADEFDREVYAEWHRPLLERLFGNLIDLRDDLYERTHSHRRDHNGGADTGECTAWPSPPYLAPVWRLIAEEIGAKRFLEIGSAIGYTAVLMADAGGPGSYVDTIEIDPGHADRAEKVIRERGLSERVRVLRGDARTILPTLTTPYDVVFADAESGGIAEDLNRLFRPGGVPAEVKAIMRVPLIAVLEALAPGTEPDMVALQTARDSYRSAVRIVLHRSLRR